MSADRPIPSVAAECASLLANVLRPTVPDVAPIVHAYYKLPDNGAGGSLHIVLDDANVDDASVEFCERWAEERGDSAGAALARVLRLMSRTQRMKLARMNKNQWPHWSAP